MKRLLALLVAIAVIATFSLSVTAVPVLNSTVGDRSADGCTFLGLSGITTLIVDMDPYIPVDGYIDKEVSIVTSGPSPPIENSLEFSRTALLEFKYDANAVLIPSKYREKYSENTNFGVYTHSAYVSLNYEPVVALSLSGFTVSTAARGSPSEGGNSRASP